MSQSRILIALDDASEIVVGPPLADLGVPFHAERERAELLAIRLREQALNEWLAELADELNSALAEYEVRLVHLDTADYLEFVSRDPNEQEADNE